MNKGREGFETGEVNSINPQLRSDGLGKGLLSDEVLFD